MIYLYVVDRTRNPMSAQDDVVIDRVVARIAEELEADALDLEPLGNVIDPDLVCGFMTEEGVLPSSELQFTYEGRQVCIAGDGAVSIERAD